MKAKNDKPAPATPKARKAREGTQEHVTFLGAAGESLTAHKLSLLGYAVNIPLNDQGDDLFAVNMSTDITLRVQVKTALPKQKPAGAGKEYTQFQVGGLKKAHLNADKDGMVYCFHLLVDVEKSVVRSLVLTQKDFRKMYGKESTTVTFFVRADNLIKGGIFIGGTPPKKTPKKPSKVLRCLEWVGSSQLVKA